MSKWVVLGILLLSAAPLFSQDSIDVMGKWIFQVETGIGSGTPSITFKQDGEKVTGKYVGQLGEADLSGTVKGKAINFSFTVDLQGNSVRVTYNGTIEGKDAMKGTVSFEGLGEGTFTAKRQ